MDDWHKCPTCGNEIGADCAFGRCIPLALSSVKPAGEEAQCPYCGQTFYAPPLHDPLKRHFDYCPNRPEELE